MRRPALLAAFALAASVALTPRVVSLAAMTDAKSPEVALPLSPVPRIDGEIRAPEWSDALRVPGSVAEDGSVEGAPVLWLARTEDALYIAVRSPIDPARGVLARAHPRPGGDALVGLDDSVQLWLAPAAASDPTLYRISFNANGALADARYQRSGGRWREDVQWQSGAALASRRSAEHWDAELGWKLPESADAWRVRVVHSGQRPLRRSGWPGPGADTDPLADMALVRFDPRAPVARLSWLGDDASPPGLRVEVANPGRRSVAVSLALHGGTGCPAPRSGEPLAGGERLRVDLDPACLASGPWLSLGREGERASLALALRATPSTAARTRPWQADLEAASLQIAHYPYPGKLRVHLDASAMPSAASIHTAQIVVRDAARREEVLRAPLALEGASGETVLEVGALGDGDYRVEVGLHGKDGRLDLGSLTRGFSRRRRPWEGNRLGETDRVIPPFTPLQVAGTRVDAVLRQHEMNDLGLWDQVVSEGSPLLAGPIHLRARVDGRNARPTPTRPIRLVRRGETEVDTDAEWRAGRLRARVRGRYEMDGMFRVELTLSGPPDTRVEQLDLVVPIRKEIATLMNAITDRVRRHHNGALPPGRGEVWSSSELKPVEIPPNFTPYLWLGDERRGIAWFAESTRDWWVDPATPLQSITRADDSVSLVVRLVTRPAALGRERKIVFGLQATPTKPVALATPGRWQFACGSELPARHLCILSTSLDFGGATAFGDVYPRNHDEAILEILSGARASGHQDAAAVKRWLSVAGVSREKHPKALRALDWSSRMMARRPETLVAYLNTHGRTWVEELEDFQDEWRPRPLGRDVRGAVEAGTPVTPTRSRQDFVLWYQERLLASGAVDGAYFDNVFMVANYDDVVGGAYRDDAGVLQPALDIFGVRELLKRSQILSYQHRGRWTTVSHMTTASIAPINSWAGAILDGEWKYGRDDFQDRFPRDVLRAQSLGLQTGSVPVYLPGIVGARSDAERERLERSVAGGAAVHGIRIWDNLFKPNLAGVWSALYRYGYGEPGTQLHHYWDARPPFSAQAPGGDVEALVAVRDGAAVALVTSFGGWGTAQLRLDRERLKLAPGGRCFDAEGSGSVETVGPGVCRFELRKHDFRVVGFGTEAWR